MRQFLPLLITAFLLTACGGGGSSGGSGSSSGSNPVPTPSGSSPTSQKASNAVVVFGTGN